MWPTTTMQYPNAYSNYGSMGYNQMNMYNNQYNMMGNNIWNNNASVYNIYNNYGISNNMGMYNNSSMSNPFTFGASMYSGGMYGTTGMYTSGYTMGTGMTGLYSAYGSSSMYGTTGMYGMSSLYGNSTAYMASRFPATYGLYSTQIPVAATTPTAVTTTEVVEEPKLVTVHYSEAWGDPHFKFKDKTGETVQIDQKGKVGSTYNVLNADGLDIDAEYKKWKEDSPQVMGAMSIKAGDQQLTCYNGKITLDGEDLTAGTTKTLSDGRTIEVKDNGNIDVKTKDGKGTISIVLEKEGYYNISTNGDVGVDTTKDKGGILGFFATEGLNMNKQEILDKYDTNKNGMIDDGDNELNTIFETKNDLGYF